ncbi:hypothetical protein EGR_05272 [Echinococcus granulosus]|uniref:BHLH domain-containing protein n=1 Tax=Echinococcus granulosus TaxID=6210 RepID=W6UFS8_ECHGR|nr:hypothetical protein EGR_05272 [Echinococcus granulosus]EUB59796.1 hypothetical protein EGR_05272 [Echinococcus granulosus]
MNLKRRVLFAPTGSPPSTLSIPLQQQIHQQPYQPVYVIPLGAAAAPVEPIIVEQPTNTRQIPHPSVPTIAPKLDAPVVSSSGAVRGKRPLDDREVRRRVKKQNMERRRRACISDKLSTLHSLAVSLVGEKPQQRPHQRTEITDILNQCVSVLQSLSELIKTEPELQLKLRRLELPSIKESSEKQRRRKQSSTSMSREAVVEEEKENVASHVSGFTPVGRNRMSITSTPVTALSPLSTPSRLHCECPPMARGQKRESTDSGLDCFASPSLGATAESSLKYMAGPRSRSDAVDLKSWLTRFLRENLDHGHCKGRVTRMGCFVVDKGPESSFSASQHRRLYRHKM